MVKLTKPLIIGKIVGVYGIKGWVKLISYTDPPENILSYLPWQLCDQNGELNTLELTQKMIQSQRILVQFKGYTDRDQAQKLVGNTVVIERSRLPQLPPHEFYWTDLEGMKVYTVQGEYLGIVQSLIETGSNDVLVIQGDKRHLIPFLPEQVVMHVDLKGQIIQVDWDPSF